MTALDGNAISGEVATVGQSPRAGAYSGRTAWTRNLRSPLRALLATETDGAWVVLCAAVVALVWANIDESSCERLWTTTLVSCDLG